MKVISVWNPKGGQGKSMLAINLAAAAVEMGLSPLLIDLDPQGTATAFHGAGHLPYPVVGGIPSKKPTADLVLIDHVAADWELPQTPLVLMPVKPGRDQFHSYAVALAKAEKAGKRVITVLTDVQPHRQNDAEVTKALRSKGAHIIPASGVFSRAAADYKTIYDPDMNRAYRIRERRQDINKVLAALLLEVGE